MFALIAGPAEPAALDRLAERLSPFPVRAWRDAEGRGAALLAGSDLLPEDAHDAQPIVTEDAVFVCRARLDERETVANRLGIDPARAAVMADSALLHQAWRRWGKACAEEVAGDFAYAAWRFRQGVLEAAVDHWGGSAALFWARLGRSLLVADNLALLLAHPAVDRALDPVALAGFMRIGIDRSSTPYAAVRALAGGHRLAWRGGDVAAERWWCPDTVPRWPRDPREPVEETRELLERAVAARLRSSGGVAATLSGGLDSGIVAAIAARCLARGGSSLDAYTAIPERGLPAVPRPGWDLDDSPYAAATAALHPNIRHHFVAPGERSVLDILPVLLGGAATPIRGSANLLWLDAISRDARAAGARVLLIGQHGNFSFSPPGTGALIELLAHRRLRDAWRLLGESAARRGTARAVAALLVRPLLRRLAYALGRAATPPVTLSFLRPEWRNTAPTPFDRPPGSRAQWLAFAAMPPHAWRSDPVDQWDLDWRDPTADRRLLERILSFPLAVFMHDGRERGLARSVGETLLPDEVRLRTRRGEQAPERGALIRRSAPAYRAALARISACSIAEGILDLPAMERSLARIAAGADDPGETSAWVQALTLGLFLAQQEARR